MSRDESSDLDSPFSPTDSPRETIETYYETLRCGEPLTPFFSEDPQAVKLGIEETLVGYADIADGLSSQTDRTSEWTVESTSLRVTERDAFAWFHDEVRLSWHDDPTGTDESYDTRWTGTLEYREPVDRWQFVSLHVSVPVDRGKPEAERSDADVLFGSEGEHEHGGC